MTYVQTVKTSICYFCLVMACFWLPHASKQSSSHYLFSQKHSQRQCKTTIVQVGYCYKILELQIQGCGLVCLLLSTWLILDHWVEFWKGCGTNIDARQLAKNIVSFGCATKVHPLTFTLLYFSLELCSFTGWWPYDVASQ
jgi:hypothetical protein